MPEWVMLSVFVEDVTEEMLAFKEIPSLQQFVLVTRRLD
jgi:hypothetical protein